VIAASVARFERSYVPVPHAGCWLWLCSVSPNGYATMRDGRSYRDAKTVQAHRFSYELHRGPVPAGLQLDHKCRTRSCVNPDHLEAVTQRENLLRGDTVTARNASATACPKGHPYSEHNTGRTRAGARVCKTCGNARVAEWKRRRRAEKRDPEKGNERNG
jgi:hypothetical protein